MYEYLLVIKYIIGYRGNNKFVLKVYFWNNDKKVKEFFKICCFDDIYIEFVYVRKIKKKLKEVENMKKYEIDVFVIDVLIMN